MMHGRKNIKLPSEFSRRKNEIFVRRNMADRQIWKLHMTLSYWGINNCSRNKTKLGRKPTFLGHPEFLVHDKTACCN